MANTYKQVYIQIVMTPKYRENLIIEPIQEEVFSYISGIIENKGHKSIIVNGMPDHVHIFVGLNLTMSISDLVREIKKSSNSFINENKLTKKKFYWQNGFGAFSYSQSHLKRVYQYILNQKQHHLGKNFKEEYMELLKKYEIDYKEEYLFKFFN